ncbi:MAG: response regulator [Pricia sp.]
MSDMLAPYIWIIDDDLVAQFNAKIKIRQAGIHCNVRCFDNTHTALVELMDPETPNNGQPDIIILDLSMPDIKGWEFLNQLGFILNEKAYPDIFLTSSSRVSSDINRAKEHAMVKEYFVKPLTPQNMELIIEGAANLKEI